MVPAHHPPRCKEKVQEYGQPCQQFALPSWAATPRNSESNIIGNGCCLTLSRETGKLTFTHKARGGGTRSLAPSSSRFTGVGVGREATVFITLRRRPCPRVEARTAATATTDLRVGVAVIRGAGVGCDSNIPKLYQHPWQKLHFT